MLEVHLKRKVELDIQPLMRQPFCVVASKDSAVGKELAATPAKRKLSLKRLADWPLVGLDRDSGIRRLMEAELRRVDLTLHFVERTGTGGWATAKEFARAGVGVALLPQALLNSDEGASFVVRRLAAQIGIQDYLIYRPQELNSAQQSLKQALITAGRKRQKIMVSLGTLK
jgi:DNA-binding transcriptional LysR family regulator